MEKLFTELLNTNSLFRQEVETNSPHVMEAFSQATGITNWSTLTIIQHLADDYYKTMWGE